MLISPLSSFAPAFSGTGPGGIPRVIIADHAEALGHNVLYKALRRSPAVQVVAEVSNRDTFVRALDAGKADVILASEEFDGMPQDDWVTDKTMPTLQAWLGSHPKDTLGVVTETWVCHNQLYAMKPKLAELIKESSASGSLFPELDEAEADLKRQGVAVQRVMPSFNLPNYLQAIHSVDPVPQNRKLSTQA